MTAADWVGFAVVVVVCVSLALIAGMTDRRDNWLRRSVFANLDSAAENGYFAPGEHLYGATPNEIAFDMLIHAEDLEGKLYTSDIEPHVRAWLSKGNRI